MVVRIPNPQVFIQFLDIVVDIIFYMLELVPSTLTLCVGPVCVLDIVEMTGGLLEQWEQ